MKARYNILSSSYPFPRTQSKKSFHPRYLGSTRCVYSAECGHLKQKRKERTPVSFRSAWKAVLRNKTINNAIAIVYRFVHTGLNNKDDDIQILSYFCPYPPLVGPENKANLFILDRSPFKNPLPIRRETFPLKSKGDTKLYFIRIAKGGEKRISAVFVIERLSQPPFIFIRSPPCRGTK